MPVISPTLEKAAAESTMVAPASINDLVSLFKSTKPYTEWPLSLVTALAGIGYKLTAGKGHSLPARVNGQAAVYLIESGVLELVVPLANGRELALGYLHPGAFIGNTEAFALIPPEETLELVPEVDCVIWRFSGDKFKELMRQNWQLAETMLGIAATRVGMGIDTIANTSLLSAEARVARCLLKSLRDSEFRVYWAKSATSQLNLTQAQLARMLGLSRQSVGTILRVFEQKGLIEMRRQLISVISPTALREIVHGPAPSNASQT